MIVNIPQNLGIQVEFIDSGEWIPVHTLPGYECCIEYYVNRRGKVKSTKGTIERILKPKTNSKGYLSVNLTQRIGRKNTISVYVHKLVALAFLDAPPTPYGRSKGCTGVTHKDGNRSNCHIDNLKWSTRNHLQ